MNQENPTLAPTAESPDLWRYSESESTMTAPEGSKRIDAMVAEDNTPMFLVKIPKESLSTKIDNEVYLLKDEADLPEDAEFYASCDSENHVIAMFITTGESVNSFEDLKNLIKDVANSPDPKDKFLFHEHKIPAVYDEDKKWILLGSSPKAAEYLLKFDKSPGPSGTHFALERIYQLYNLMCDESKNPMGFARDGSLRNTQYYDVYFFNGDTFINSSAERMPKKLVSTIHSLGIKTIDQLPPLRDATSLTDILRSLRGENAYPDASLEEDVISSLSYMDRSNSNFVILSSFGRGFSDPNERKDFFHELSAMYRHENGYPSAVVLLTPIETQNDRGTRKFLLGFGKTHPEAETATEPYAESYKAELRIDGVIRVRLPDENAFHSGIHRLDFDFYCQRVTLPNGKRVKNPEEVFIQLQEIERTVNEDVIKRKHKPGLGFKLDPNIKF